ncbi:hypothetical protein KCU61_g652, partial [Aureobasidium melanogenum]
MTVIATSQHISQIVILESTVPVPSALSNVEARSIVQRSVRLELPTDIIQKFGRNIAFGPQVTLVGSEDLPAVVENIGYLRVTAFKVCNTVLVPGDRFSWAADGAAMAPLIERPNGRARRSSEEYNMLRTLQMLSYRRWERSGETRLLSRWSLAGMSREKEGEFCRQVIVDPPVMKVIRDVDPPQVPRNRSPPPGHLDISLVICRSGLVQRSCPTSLDTWLIR